MSHHLRVRGEWGQKSTSCDTLFLAWLNVCFGPVSRKASRNSGARLFPSFGAYGVPDSTPSGWRRTQGTCGSNWNLPNLKYELSLILKKSFFPPPSYICSLPFRQGSLLHFLVSFHLFSVTSDLMVTVKVIKTSVVNGGEITLRVGLNYF